MKSPEKSKNATREKHVEAVSIGLFVLAFATASLGFLRAMGRSSIDLEVLWFLVAAAMILLFDRVREFNFSKDGISAKLAEIDEKFEEVSSRVDEVDTKVDDVETIAIDAAQAKLQAETTSSGEAPPSSRRSSRGDTETEKKLELPPETPGNDPQKGRFGGLPSRNGRVLTAKVVESRYSERYFEIELRVASTETAREALEGEVTFYLHDSFPNAVQSVRAERGAAILKLLSYGAFTVGAVCDDGGTLLELDLALDASFPKRFRDS